MNVAEVALGFAAGTIATALFFLWREEQFSTTTATTRIEVRPSSGWSNSPFTRVSSEIAQTPESAVPATVAQAMTPAAPDQATAEIALSTAPAQTAAAAAADRQRLRRSRSGRPLDPVLELPAEFESIVEKTRVHPDSIAQLHDDFSAEQEKSNWAYATEQALNDYFGRVAPQHGVAINNVSCRDALCEILAVASQPSPGLMWHDVMHDLYRSKPPVQVGPVRWSMESGNGQTYILTFIRKPPYAR
jgi:hypothetical protein